MVKRLFSSLLLGLTLIMLAAGGYAQSAALSAFVDRTDISINDVFTLTIRTDASLGNTRPSLGGLNSDFEQVGGSSTRSTYTSDGNGNTQAWNEFSIMLRPLHTGRLTIPAFRIGSEATAPIYINVGEASTPPGDTTDEIFIQSSVSKESIYVQEQLLYTIKIYYSIGFDQGAQLTSPLVADAVVQQLGSDDNFQEVVNGIGYNVTERRFVIYPQSSGEITMPPVYFTASVGRRSGINRFFNNRSQAREINLQSDTHTIEVQPRADTYPQDGTWLPAADLTLEETWSGPLDNIEVGAAVTRNIVLTARGLSSSLLPGLEYAAQPGLKFYPDQPVREDEANRNGVVGKRSEGTAIVASQPGTYLLPEVRMPWWNTETDTLEMAVLPARTLTVVAPAGALDTDVAFVPIDDQQAANTPEPVLVSQGSGAPLLWMGTTVFFASAWLLSTMLWLRSRREQVYAELLHPYQQAPKPEKKQKDGSVRLPDAEVCRRVLQTACTNNNLHDIRSALLKWGQASFGTGSILSLEQLATRCGDERLAQLAKALDSALYGTRAGTFSSWELYETVAALHKRDIKTESGDRFALPPLYKS